MKNKGAAILILAAGLAAGYGMRAYRDSGVFEQMQQDRHMLAAASYSWFASFGQGDGGSLPRLKAIWRKELGGELNATVKNQDYAVNYTNAWGDAYYVMKDDGENGWDYREAMDGAAQDEMIRYLCYRVQKAKYVPFFSGPITGTREFEALRTYPSDALERNAKQIRWAMDDLHMGGGFTWSLRESADGFLAQCADQKWAFDCCQTVFKNYVNRDDALWFNFTRHLLSANRRPGSQAGATSVLKWIAVGRWKDEYANAFDSPIGKRVLFVVDRDFPELKPSASLSAPPVKDGATTRPNGPTD